MAPMVVTVFRTSKGLFSDWYTAILPINCPKDDDPRSETYGQREVPRPELALYDCGSYFALTPLDVRS